MTLLTVIKAANMYFSHFKIVRLCVVTTLHVYYNVSAPMQPTNGQTDGRNTAAYRPNVCSVSVVK